MDIRENPNSYLGNFLILSDGTGNGFSNIRDTFAESLQLQMLVLHQKHVHLQSWRCAGLSS